MVDGVKTDVLLILLYFTPRFTHLQHAPFNYSINLNNNTAAQAMGTVRIFLSPRFDERGTEMLLRDQRLLMTEMDKFIVACKILTFRYLPNKKNYQIL